MSKRLHNNHNNQAQTGCALLLFGDRSVEPGGRHDAAWRPRLRPEVLAEPRPPGRVQRHVVEHITELVRVAPMVQILDAPVPQTVDQLPDVLQFSDTLTTDPEQVIEVSKIFPEDISMRTSLRDTQLAEKLVEVPTIVSYSILQRIMEQNVDIPFPVVEGVTLVFKVFPLDRVQQPRVLLRNAFLSGLWSRSLISPLVEAFKSFAQDNVHPLLSSCS